MADYVLMSKLPSLEITERMHNFYTTRFWRYECVRFRFLVVEVLKIKRPVDGMRLFLNSQCEIVTFRLVRFP